MANGNGKANVGKEEKPAKKESKKEEAPKVPTMVSILKPIMVAGVESKAVAVKKALDAFKAKGITHNVRGGEITEAKVMTHLGNIERDIATKRKGWWMGFQIVEKENFRQWKAVEAL